MKKQISSIFAISAGIMLAFCPRSSAKEEKEPATFEETLEYVSKPRHGFGRNCGPFESQTCYRLGGACYDLRYANPETDSKRWVEVLNNTNSNIYTRICAAYFLGDSSEEARRFLESELSSENLRHRYNAAEAVEQMLIRRDPLLIGSEPASPWAIDVLLKHVASGALDGSGVTSSPSGDSPDGDLNDIMISPLSSICTVIGFTRCKRAVPVFMGVLERKPDTKGAASALGMIGDPAAIPVLLKILNGDQDTVSGEAASASLGLLKAKEAVQVLMQRLERLVLKPLYHESEMDAILIALLRIGDRSVAKDITNFIAKKPPKSVQAVAKRVLAQLASDDDAADLLALLNKETEEFEKKKLMHALCNYGSDKRVIEALAKITHKSASVFDRSSAIEALGMINTKASLLVLADLVDVKFPKDLQRSWIDGGKDEVKDLNLYLHEGILWQLKQKTGKDLPPASGPWRSYLETYEPNGDAVSQPQD